MGIRAEATNFIYEDVNLSTDDEEKKASQIELYNKRLERIKVFFEKIYEVLSK